MHLDLKNISESKIVRKVIISIGVVIVILTILFIGINLGEHRARFAGQFGDNFERNFIEPRSGMKNMMLGGMMPGGHGAVGEILSVNSPLTSTFSSDLSPASVPRVKS
jgi:hypothetical protein